MYAFVSVLTTSNGDFCRWERPLVLVKKLMSVIVILYTYVFLAVWTELLWKMDTEVYNKFKTSAEIKNINIVACLLKAIIVKPSETAVGRERL
jgi:hypothetical protein